MSAPPAARLPISAVLITRNAGAQLDACLRSVDFCAEIVIVDSGSEDDTLAVAERHGARVVREAWRGFGPMKQFAVERAAHDWVLCVDADERVGEALRHGIQQAFRAVPPGLTFGPAGGTDKPPPGLTFGPASGTDTPPAGPAFKAWRFARCNRFMGRYLRHGEGYPDWSLRLFDRRHARWSDDEVHEKVLTDAAVGTLAGDLLHDTAETLERYLAKQDRYTTLAAQTALAAGRRAGPAQLLLSPALRFVKFYVLRLGFLDGLPGLVHILIGCQNSFAKYAKMIDLERRRFQ